MTQQQQQLFQQIEQFDKKYDNRKLEAAISLHEQFMLRFPRSELAHLPLEAYALGRQGESFSWWLEFNTLPLGSIKGGNAAKHIIYYSKKDGDWKIPSGETSVSEVWQKLRSDMISLLSLYDREPYGELDAGSYMSRANMVRGKLLFMYHPHLFLPIYLLDHLRFFLEALGVPKEQWAGKDSMETNRLLAQTVKSVGPLEDWHPVKIKDFLYGTYLPEEKFFKVSPGEDAKLWPACKQDGYIAVGWDEMGDLTQYPDYEEFKNAFHGKGYQSTASKNTEKANELWQFYNLKPGDQIVANKGKSHILAIGTVTGQGYAFRPELESHRHTAAVSWDLVFDPPLEIQPQSYWPMKTVYELSKKQVNEWKNAVSDASAIDSGVEEHSFAPQEESFFGKLEQALDRKGQCILYGPPGTGKTYTARRYIEWKRSKAGHDGVRGEAYMEMVTFHPSFNYEDFIEGYKPGAESSGSVSFALEKGIFAQLCARAQASPHIPHYLIIDELNRGNVPKIFGEIITLLEKDKRGVTLRLPQSKESFAIPPNVLIIATMNTSDRSIKMMDAALKRRFAFIECMPRYDLLQEEIDILGLSPGAILQSLNEALVRTQGRDKQIGHAYMMKDGQALASLSELREVYELEIIPLIQEYCFDDYELLAEIVGGGFVDAVAMRIRTELFSGLEDAFSAELIKRFKG
ncbi:AAA family ATPase [Paenibacillus mesophilus]|uniref:AAA family ATPase n=1 Tax=Paenibacillus mesophilus TaxID=2582849 RepID=UPI001305280B|nr:AAA family ATPase [Paenibacillus mesophilus]